MTRAGMVPFSPLYFHVSLSLPGWRCPEHHLLHQALIIRQHMVRSSLHMAPKVSHSPRSVSCTLSRASPCARFPGHQATVSSQEPHQVGSSVMSIQQMWQLHYRDVKAAIPTTRSPCSQSFPSLSHRLAWGTGMSEGASVVPPPGVGSHQHSGPCAQEQLGHKKPGSHPVLWWLSLMRCAGCNAHI